MIYVRTYIWYNICKYMLFGINGRRMYGALCSREDGAESLDHDVWLIREEMKGGGRVSIGHACCLRSVATRLFFSLKGGK